MPYVNITYMHQAIALKYRIKVRHEDLVYGNIKISRVKAVTAESPHKTGHRPLHPGSHPDLHPAVSRSCKFIHITDYCPLLTVY
jgi:hypothetical protein